MNSVNDNGNVGWAFLGFFFPIIGLILYIVWKDQQPNNANSAGKGAIIAVITVFIITIFGGVILSLLVATLNDLYY